MEREVKAALRATEDFAHAGYPDCEALLIVEVEGSEAEIDEQLGLILQIARKHDPVELRESRSEEEAKKIWLGRKSAFGAMGQIADYMVLDGTIPVSALPDVLKRIGEMSRDYGLEVGNVFHAGVLEGSGRFAAGLAQKLGVTLALPHESRAAITTTREVTATERARIERLYARDFALYRWVLERV